MPRTATPQQNMRALAEGKARLVNDPSVIERAVAEGRVLDPKVASSSLPVRQKPIDACQFTDTGYSYAMSLIRGKHKMSILYCIAGYQPVRFNAMRRYLGGITDRTLSTNLKELEDDNLVVRKVFPQVPPKVEYRLTKRGESLMEVLDQLCAWGELHRNGK